MIGADDLTPPQYGTSMHWPGCRIGACTGCLPPFTPPPAPPGPQLDLSIFRPALGMRIVTRPQDPNTEFLG